MAKGAKRTKTDTVVPYIPADPQDIMALLGAFRRRAGHKATRKRTKRELQRERKARREYKKLIERLRKPRKKDRGGPRR
jgi:hypothetical protein